MLLRITTFLIGTGCLWYGWHIFKRGWSYLYGYPVSNATGVIVALFGVALIVFAIFRKSTPDKEEDKFLICPKCKTPFNQKDVSEGQCPKCDVELEDLEGFYERHPELKVRNNKPGRLG